MKKHLPQRRKGAKRSAAFSFAPLRLCGGIFLVILALVSCTKAPSGPLAFVSNERDGTITVIDTKTDRVVSTIKVGGRLRGIRLSADRNTLWVAISYPTNQSQGEDKIAQLDLNGNIIAKYEAGTDPENFVLDDHATRLYIANEDAGTASITDIKANRVIASMPVGLEPEGAAMSPDGRWVYITSEASSRVSVIDTKDHTVMKTIELPRVDGSAQLKPKGIVVSADGKRVYVATGRGNSVAVIDGEQFAVITLIPVGQRPWGIALTPDGRKLYTANGVSNDVSVIDTSTNKVITTIKAGDGPWGIAL